jgi:formate hydrogenlyase transcriptional activator
MTAYSHFEENDERRSQEALLQVADLIVRQSTLPELSQELVRLLHRFFPFQAAGFCLHDSTKNVMQLIVCEGAGGSNNAELPLEGTTCGWVMESQRPLLLADMRKETRFAVSLEVLKQMGAVSFCEVPLTTTQRRMGAMWLAGSNGHIYNDGDVRLLCQVGDWISLALQNVLTGSVLQRHNARLEALLDLSAAVIDGEDVDEVIAAILQKVQKAVQHDFIGVALHEEGTGSLRIYDRASWENLQKRDSRQGGLFLAASDRSFLHGEARVRGRDELRSTRLEALAVDHDLESLASVPLISHRGALGVLLVGSRQSKAFLSQDLSFLRQAAGQISAVLENFLASRDVNRLNQTLRREKLYLQNEIRSVLNFDEIIGESPALKRVLAQVETVARSGATVLILGETGTGKELVARATHRLSGRSDSSFIKLNCAAIPTGLLESELFGHERGAFTGAVSQKVGRLELADGGTLFLDEIGEIPLELQPKLLRVLQDHEFERLGGNRTIKVDIRLIAATNRDLAKRVSSQEFRSDLYYRLHVFPLRVPTLRERSRDIPLLVRYFVQKFSKRMNKKIETIPVDSMRVLEGWQWPGNVRELENFIERSVILTEGTTLTVPLVELTSTSLATHHAGTLEDLERQHILRVLRETGGVIAGVHGAAARLGMKRTTLQSKIQRLGIVRAEYEN